MPRSLPPALSTIALLACLAALAGCGGGDAPPTRTGATGEAEEALPAPGTTGGRSITGMPDAPGPGEVPLAGAPLQPVTAVPVDGVLPLEDNPETGLGAITPITPITPVTAAATGGDAMPGAAIGVPAPADAGMAAADVDTAEAAAVVSAYYAALAGGQHGQAYALWSDGGRSSGQTPEQFARGFAGASGIVAQPGEPRLLADGDAARVEVPVSVTTRLADGGERRQVGAYVLRRAADGAGPSAWRIVSAELRELQP